MRFPDSVEILKPAGADGYGNPGRSFENPTVVPVSGFEIRRDELLFLAADSGIEEGDRLRIRGKVFRADELLLLRSPSREVAYRITLKEVEGV